MDRCPECGTPYVFGTFHECPEIPHYPSIEFNIDSEIEDDDGINRSIVSSGIVMSNLDNASNNLKSTVNWIDALPIEPNDKQEVHNVIGDFISRFDSFAENVYRKIGKYERGFGDLIPKIITEYCIALEYNAFETPMEVDQQYKVDIIAIKNDEVHAVQVKKDRYPTKKSTMILEKP